MDNFSYYVIVLLMIIIGFVICKKAVGCMIRSVITFILVVILGMIYYVYFK